MTDTLGGNGGATVAKEAPTPSSSTTGPAPAGPVVVPTSPSTGSQALAQARRWTVVGFAWSRQARLAFAVAFLLIGITVAAGYAANPEAAGAAPRNSGGAFAGTWAGVLTGSSGGVHNERIVIVVNAGESSGTWTLSTTCRGRLTLDGISGGYHHFRRRVSSGAACAGGDVDCLMLVGANLYDSVTPHPGGVALSGTLRRVRHR